MQASYGTGPVGTGAHLIGYTSGRRDPQDVEAWLTILFVPLVPMGRWRVAGAGQEPADEAPRNVTFTVQMRSRPTVGLILRRLALAIGIVGVTVAPIIFGVRMIGESWATELLTGSLGRVPDVLSSLGEIGKKLGRIVAGGIPLLGSAVELGMFLGGAVLPILVLMRLDERIPRVPFRMVLSRTSDVAVRENAA